MEYYAVTKAHIKSATEYYERGPIKGSAEIIDEGHIRYDVPSQEWRDKMLEEYPLEFCLRAGVKIQESASRKSYRQAIVAERITGMSQEDFFINEHMRWGIINEDAAANIYVEWTGNIIKEAPYMMHPTLMCGASPDRLVIDKQTGELGNLEIKCLKSTNHLYKIIDTNEIPEEYIDQIQMQMWIDGRDWCDFVGYDSRVLEDLQIFIKRVEYDEFYVDNVLVPSITRFLAECDRDQRRFYALARKRREEMKAKFVLM